MQKRQKRVFEVTGGQIFFALVIAAIALTAAFEIGISVGEKRVINAEMEAAQQSSIRWHNLPSASKEDASSPESPSDTPTQSPEVREDEEKETTSRPNTQARQPGEVPTGGDLPLESPTAQTIEQPGTERAQYTVQVGTFGSYQNAENLVKLLESYEYKSWLRSESAAGRTLYSVCVGGFDKRDEAERFGRSLRDRLSFITDYVVRQLRE